MSRRIIILVTVIVFSITVFAAENSSDKSGAEVPEYPTDFESQQQTAVPMQMPNQFQGRTNRPMIDQWNNVPDFTQSRQRSIEKIREMQRKAREQEEQAMKQALGVDEAQWRKIEPKIEKVKTCRQRASISTRLPFSSSFISTSSPQGGGFQFQSGGGSSNITTAQSSFQTQSRHSGQETQGERICRELNTLLDNPNSSPEAIRQKMTELRQERENAKRQLDKAQKELREVLTLRQQARLVLMGILD